MNDGLVLALASLLGAVAAPEAGAAPDEIIVTGRRGVPASALPLSVTQVPATTPFPLPRTPAETLNRVPGVQVQEASGQEHLTAIRSPVLTGGAGAGSFLYLQDGVPLRSAGFANINGLIDAYLPFAETVEVTRGPGDVTFGSNALHGAIDVRSPDPLGPARTQVSLATETAGRARLMAQRRADGRFLGVYGGTDDGTRADSGGSEWKLSLGLGHDGARATHRTRLFVHGLDQETAGFVEGPEAFRNAAARAANANPAAFRDVRHALLTHAATLTPNARDTVEITPYALWADTRLRLHFFPSQAIETTEQAALGLQTIYRAPRGLTQFEFGLDTELAHGTLRETQDRPTIGTFTQGLHYDYAVRADMAAGFIRIDRQLTPRLHAEGGLRHTLTRYDYDNLTLSDDVGRFQRRPDRQDAFGATTARIALLWQASDTVRTRLSLARGARPPQTTDLYRLQRGQDVDGVGVETLDMAEWAVHVGKPRWQAELVGFTGRKTAVSFRDADGLTVTDGATRHDGVELDMAARLGERWQIALSGTYAEHRYDFDRPVGIAAESIRRGARVDTAPVTLGEAQLQYTPNASWQWQLSAQHVGRYATDAANDHFYDGHTLLNAFGRAEITPTTALSIGVINILDTDYATRADFAFGTERYFPGEGTTLRIGIDVNR